MNPNDTRPHILIVDDDPRNVKLLERILQAEGYATVAVGDGESALAVLPELRPSLVLLDVMMPGLDGFQVCERIKSDPATRTLPVILLTALNGTGEKVRGLGAGAEDFITKPMDRGELLARVRTQLRLKALLDEVTDSRESLARQNRQLQHLEEMRRDLVHMLVHDLKSPLVALQLSTDLLQDPDGPDPAAVTNIAECCRQITLMVQNILDVAKMEEGRLQIERRPVDFAGLAAASARAFEMIARRDGKTIELDLQAAPASAAADPGLVGRVIDNLVSNAIKVSPSGGCVIVAVDGGAGAVRVSVSDRGPGIPEPLREAVFDKFRSGGGRRQGQFGNHGLGLTFCKMAVEAHGGRIWVDPHPDGGSVFRFTLPGVAPMVVRELELAGAGTGG